MHISGLQKLTALDFPDKLACTVFTPGCNLRCPFCHNGSLVLRGQEQTYPLEDFFAFLKKRRGILDGVCITGGEPLLQPDLADFIRQIRALGFLVKLDTNGFFPERLQPLLEQGLVDYVAMDLKNSPRRYPETCGFPQEDPEKFLAPVKKSIALLMGGKTPHEFRTTVVRQLHTPEDIREAGLLISGAKKWFLQCFKDSGDILSPGLSAPDRADLAAMQAVAAGFCERCELRGV